MEIARSEAAALAMLGVGTGTFEAEARHLRSIMGEIDWYALAGTSAERELRERCVRLVSCSEFGELLALPNTKEKE